MKRRLNFHGRRREVHFAGCVVCDETLLMQDTVDRCWRRRSFDEFERAQFLLNRVSTDQPDFLAHQAPTDANDFAHQPGGVLLRRRLWPARAALESSQAELFVTGSPFRQPSATALNGL